MVVITRITSGLRAEFPGRCGEQIGDNPGYGKSFTTESTEETRKARRTLKDLAEGFLVNSTPFCLMVHDV
jgi:hypothetical protein